MIKFQHVTQRFADGTVAFRDLSFSVDDGELVLITGPSGSGKTTIMNLIMNELRPHSGEIIFNDQPLQQIKRSNLPHHRRKIGVVFQDYKLIEELNVWENIALPLYIQGEKEADIEDRVTDLLKLVQLVDKALVFPKQLSGGEAQRISIARALATGPNVIFADEPTGNLDEATSIHIVNLLMKINELGTTLIIATHDPLIIKRFKTKVIDLAKLQADVRETKKDEEDQGEKKESQTQSKKEKKVKKESVTGNESLSEKEDAKSPQEIIAQSKPKKKKITLSLKKDKVASKLSSLFGKKNSTQSNEKDENKDNDEQKNQKEALDEEDKLKNK